MTWVELSVAPVLSVQGDGPLIASLSLLNSCVAGLALFFFGVSTVIARHPHMFLRPHARRHRICGLLHLCWLMIGVLDLALGNTLFPRLHQGSFSPLLLYHILLGVFGTAATLSAAFDFRYHVHVKNKASGTIEEKSTVSFNEMVEHSFYQGLNLIQIVTLHFLDSQTSSEEERGDRGYNSPSPFLSLFTSSFWLLRIGAIALVTAPWLFRCYFPVNSFMANYKDLSWKEYTPELLMYRIKKWQYVFYKHALLHGLNVSVATQPNFHLTQQKVRVLSLTLSLFPLCSLSITIWLSFFACPLPSLISLSCYSVFSLSFSLHCFSLSFLFRLFITLMACSFNPHPALFFLSFLLLLRSHPTPPFSRSPSLSFSIGSA